jgi:hypothetical protein
MNAPRVERDERTTAIENAGYKWSYLVLSFGLITVVAFRSLVRGEESWDLICLVILGGVVNAGYQARHHVTYRRWYVLAAVTMVAAALVAALLLTLRT